jgi:hypothetical protein
MDIWIFIQQAQSIRFNALLKVCQRRIDPKYSAPRLQRHVEGMVGKFLTRTEKGSQEVFYSLIPDQFDVEPIKVNFLGADGRKMSLDEIVQLLIDYFEQTLYSELEITLKEFLTEEPRSEEKRAIARKQGQLLVAFYKDAMAGRPESEYRDVLKNLKARRQSLNRK